MNTHPLSIASRLLLASLALTSSAASVVPSAAAAQPKPGTGRLVLSFDVIEDASHRKYEALFKSSAVFRQHLDRLNKVLLLPGNIDVVFAECDEANAFYDPEERQITLCYEMITEMERVFKDDADTADELNSLIFGATLWTFYHELGHGLVHLLELPIPGKEDDAVDELATVILIGDGDVGSALASAREWYVTGVEEVDGAQGVEDLAFYDEHSLSMQRFYNIVCLVKGSDPKEFTDLDDEFPELAGRDCENEYQKKDTTWGRLLGPYLRKN